MSDPVLIAYVTCPQAKIARQIAALLVENNHAACVNIVPNLVSVYRWDNKIQTDDETLLMIKTTEHAFAGLRDAVLAAHPDELPEIIAVPVAHGLPGYLDWVQQETTPS